MPNLTEKKLLELGYQDLYGGISWNFIHMLNHFQAIQSMGVKYEGIDFDVIRFSSPSEETGGSTRWQQLIHMVDLRDMLKDPTYTIGDQVRMALSGDLKVHCDCPAFLYYGYRWILTQMDAAIYPEERPPNIRNPRRHGTVCKHLGVVIRVLPFWWTNMAGDLQREGYGTPRATVPAPPAEPPAEEPLAQPPAQPPAQQQQPTGRKPSWGAWQRAGARRGIPIGGESLPSYEKLLETFTQS